ncbi:MAG: hypothetical protein RDU20_14980 [Desulfomonilaceae bacterium]|nr:hypothetical protein [Desulfomonilaceae bacterium]
MTNDLSLASGASGCDYHIGLFEPEDAVGIVELFRDVYGDEYPIRIFYDPDALIEANREGTYRCAVARRDDGRVIGVTNVYRSAPNPDLYEWGVGLTLKEFRGSGVFNRIGDYLADVAIPALGIGMMFGEAVCNHVHTQKMVARNGFADVTLEVALMPAQIYTKEPGVTGRVAALLQFRTYKSRPHRVFLPAVYREQLRFIYSDLDDKREFGIADEPLPAGTPSKTAFQIFDFANLARMIFHEVGSDFDAKSRELEDQARDANTVVFQVSLPLNQVSVGRAVETLRSRGYFLGGPLIQWFGDDGLLMQKVECNPDFDEIRLHSDRARQIKDLVQQDWERSGRR